MILKNIKLIDILKLFVILEIVSLKNGWENNEWRK